MFDQPTKRDIDYALAMLMHEAGRKIDDEKNRIKSEAIKHEALQRKRVVVNVTDVTEKVHMASLSQAGQIRIDFVQRRGKHATKNTAWARPRLENLSNSVLGGNPPNGFPDDHPRIIRRY